MLIATVRANSVNLPLFFHVLGALLLVGSLFTTAVLSAMAARRKTDRDGLLRLAFRTVLLGVLPAYIVMRVGAEWTSSKEGLDNLDPGPTWLRIGDMTADAGALLVLISAILAGIGLRKLRNGGGVALGTSLAVISGLMIAADLVAVWAMATKPI